MTAIIRSLQSGDYAVWKTMYDDYNDTVNDDIYARAIFNQLIASDTVCRCFVAVKEDAVIGFVHFVFHHGIKHGKQVLYMEDVFVDEAHRGQRIAGKLIDKGLELARENKCGRFYWFTDADNQSAQKTYERYTEGAEKLRYAIEIN